MQQRTQLLIIDPQNDFCDLPASHCPQDPLHRASLAPALPVAGAHADMLRLAGLIRQGGAALSDIVVTLDSHQRLDIAHPGFWRRLEGAQVLPVTPFTPITAAQVRDAEFQPRDPQGLPRALAYLDELERRGRYTLMVWPVHCEIGSWGHNVHADVRAACNAWEEREQRNVQFVSKGENPWTEHYSAVQAEVPDALDGHTLANQALLLQLGSCDALLIAGEASSHCVKASTEHIVEHLGPAFAGRITLLADCMSPVGGFEAQHHAFLADMHARGLRISHAADVARELQAGAAH